MKEVGEIGVGRAGGWRGEKGDLGKGGQRKGREERQCGVGGLSIKASGTNKHHLGISAALTSPF